MTNGPKHHARKSNDPKPNWPSHLQQHVVQVRVVQTLRKVLKERRAIDSSSTTATADSDQFDSEISIGMECFQRQHQEYLDKYIGSEQKAGEKLYTINDLKNDVSWDST